MTLFDVLHKIYARIERRYPRFVEFCFATFMRLVRAVVRRPHLVVRRYGHFFKLSLNDVTLTPKLLLGRIHEPLETHFMEAFVRAGDVVVDVGANFGWFTVLLADLVGEKGRVIAFEPDPTNVALLRDNIALNGAKGRINVVQAAAGAARGTATLYRTEVGNYGDQRLFDTVTDGFAWTGAREKVTVDVIPVDDIVTAGDNLTFVKMDIQGYEPHALEGMLGTVAGHPRVAILSEFWPAGLTDGGTDPSAYLQRFCDLGFSLFELLDDRKAILRAQPEQLIKRYPTAGATFTNIVAIHPSMTANLPNAPSYSVRSFADAVRGPRA